jgi:hypothetical protein
VTALVYPLSQSCLLVLGNHSNSVLVLYWVPHTTIQKGRNVRNVPTSECCVLRQRRNLLALDSVGSPDRQTGLMVYNRGLYVGPETCLLFSPSEMMFFKRYADTGLSHARFSLYFRRIIFISPLKGKVLFLSPLSSFYSPTPFFSLPHYNNFCPKWLQLISGERGVFSTVHTVCIQVQPRPTRRII